MCSGNKRGSFSIFSFYSTHQPVTVGRHKVVRKHEFSLGITMNEMFNLHGLCLHKLPPKFVAILFTNCLKYVRVLTETKLKGLRRVPDLPTAALQLF